MKSVMFFLPYAAIIRLSVGCWMFSAGDVLSASFDSLEVSREGISVACLWVMV